MPRTGLLLQKIFNFFFSNGFLRLHYLMPRTGLLLQKIFNFFQQRFSAPSLPNAQDTAFFTNILVFIFLCLEIEEEDLSEIFFKDFL